MIPFDIQKDNQMTDINIEKLEPMDLFPRWIYNQEEWDIIVSETIVIKDGTRYMMKDPLDIKEEEIDAFASSLL